MAFCPYVEGGSPQSLSKFIFLQYLHKNADAGSEWMKQCVQCFDVHKGCVWIAFWVNEIFSFLFTFFNKSPSIWTIFFSTFQTSKQYESSVFIQVVDCNQFFSLMSNKMFWINTHHDDYFYWFQTTWFSVAWSLVRSDYSSHFPVHITWLVAVTHYMIWQQLSCTHL